MVISTPGFRPALVAACVAGAALLGSATTGFAESGVFAGLAGYWSGGGTVTLDNGKRERIRCRASYAVRQDGNAMNQSLVCASDSYKFNLKSDVVARGGKLSGSWSEKSRSVSGNLSGRADPGHFEVVVSGPSFDARLTLTTRQDRQDVTIRSEGAFRDVSISLKRS